MDWRSMPYWFKGAFIGFILAVLLDFYVIGRSNLPEAVTPTWTTAFMVALTLTFILIFSGLMLIISFLRSRLEDAKKTSKKSKRK